MSEIASITSAKHHRNEVAIWLRIDQRRLDAIKTSQKAEANTRRKAQLVDQRIEKTLQQARVRRNDAAIQIQIDQTHAREQQAKNTIAGDLLFKKTRAAIAEELNQIRDSREASEATLIRDLELQHIKTAALDAFMQRAKDSEKALFEWTGRIKGRRVIEKNADLQLAIDLKLSLDRIIAAQNQQPPLGAPSLGLLLDVSA